MKWLEVTVTTAPAAADAIADFFFEARSGGVEDIPANGDVTRLRAYLPVGPTTTVTLDALRARLAALPAFGLDVGPGLIETAEVDETRWVEAWKVHVHPLAVGRIWITPTWDRRPPPRNSIVIELDPGMAFGSGLHASTQLCLTVLDDRVRRGDTVFEVGTGSGILAIAAAKLGASRVLAIDADPVAVAVARANVEHNSVTAVVQVAEGNLLDGVEGAADLVVANLTADLHLTFLPTARPHVAHGGVLAASGITDTRMDEVVERARMAGFVLADTLTRDEWRCLVLTDAR